MQIKITFWLFALLLLVGCKAKPRPATPLGDNELKDKALQLIKCLNAYQFDCVSQCYADDYESWEPSIKMADKAVFIEKMKGNYINNKLQVRAEILEFRQRAEMGYVHLQWKLYSISKDETFAELLLDKQATQIWERNDRGEWVLKRSWFGS